MSFFKKLLNTIATFSFLGPGTAANMIKNGIISPEEAWSLVDQGALFVDVRSDSEVSEGMLSGALHLPLDQLEFRLADLDQYKNKNLVIYCAVGGRAERAREFLAQQGFSSLYNAGGYRDLIAHRSV